MQYRHIILVLTAVGSLSNSAVFGHLIALHTPDEHVIYVRKDVFERESALVCLLALTERDCKPRQTFSQRERRRMCNHYNPAIEWEDFRHHLESRLSGYLLCNRGNEHILLERTGDVAIDSVQQIDLSFYRGDLLLIFEGEALIRFAGNFYSETSLNFNHWTAEHGFDIQLIYDLFNTLGDVFTNVPNHLTTLMRASLGLLGDAEMASLVSEEEMINEVIGMDGSQIVAAQEFPSENKGKAEAAALPSIRSLHEAGDVGNQIESMTLGLGQMDRNHLLDKTRRVCDLSGQGIVSLDDINLVSRVPKIAEVRRRLEVRRKEKLAAELSTELVDEQLECISRPSNHIQVLDLSNNEIEELPAGVFSRELFPSLEVVTLRDNSIRNVDEYCFADVSSTLKRIDLSGNQIEWLGGGIFRDCASVEMILLAENNLSTIGEDLFVTLQDDDESHASSRLKVLDLSGNQLETVPGAIFMPLQALEEINLRNNQLTQLSAGCFRPCSRLSLIDLRGNRLQQLPDNFFMRGIGEDESQDVLTDSLLCIRLEGNEDLNADMALVQEVQQRALSHVRELVSGLVSDVAERVNLRGRAYLQPRVVADHGFDLRRGDQLAQDLSNVMVELEREEGIAAYIIHGIEPGQHDTAELVQEAVMQNLFDLIDMFEHRSDLDDYLGDGETARFIGVLRGFEQPMRASCERLRAEVERINSYANWAWWVSVAPSSMLLIFSPPASPLLAGGLALSVITGFCPAPQWAVESIQRFIQGPRPELPERPDLVGALERLRAFDEAKRAFEDESQALLHKFLSVINVVKRYTDALYMVLYDSQDAIHEKSQALLLKDISEELKNMFFRIGVAADYGGTHPSLFQSFLAHELLPESATELFMQYYQSLRGGEDDVEILDEIINALSPEERALCGDTENIRNLLRGISFIDLGVQAYRTKLEQYRLPHEALAESDQAFRAIREGMSFLKSGLTLAINQFLRKTVNDIEGRELNANRFNPYLALLKHLMERANACLKLLAYYQNKEVLNEIKQQAHAGHTMKCMICLSDIDMSERESYMVGNPCGHVVHLVCDPSGWCLGKCPECRSLLDTQGEPWIR